MKSIEVGWARLFVSCHRCNTDEELADFTQALDDVQMLLDERAAQKK